MSKFAGVLNTARDRLRVSEPARSRILLEMAADLEDSYQHFLSRGSDEAEAQRLAEEAFGTSDEALAHLSRIHAAGKGSAADRLLNQIGAWWARILLVVILGFEILIGVRLLTDQAFYLFVSPFLWPIGVLAAATFAFTVWKLWQIFSSAGTDVRRLREGLEIPLCFACASLLLAGCGLLFHLQRFLRINAAGSPESLFMNFAGWMAKMSSMMTVALLTAIISGLVWFVLSSLVARTEVRHVDSLLSPARG